MGFVDKVPKRLKEVEEACDEQRSQTKTRGERVRPAGRPLGEGVYCIARHEDHTHLVYALELPKQSNEAQREMNVSGKGSVIDYSSTKEAIVSFTRPLAVKLASEGIRVNAVAPGSIWTPLILATFSEEKVERFGTDVPMGRTGEPAEVGPAYVYLASRDSSYVTGQVIHINGGEIVNG